jgi:hypothetical protein
MRDGWFLVLVLAHVLGDFYIQSPALARQKNHRLQKVAVHALLYALPFLPCIVFFSMRPYTVMWLLFPIITHGLIDVLKYMMLQRGGVSERNLFIGDQILHILTLVLTSCMLNTPESGPIPVPWLSTLLQGNGVDPDSLYSFLSWTLFVLLIGKPANICFIKSFSHLSPGRSENSDAEEDGPAEVRNPGAVIGFLERLLIGMCLAVGQYGAIAIVLAAKTIARHKQLEDKPFAEYYLIGTLYSIVFAFLCYFLIAAG